MLMLPFGCASVSKERITNDRKGEIYLTAGTEALAEGKYTDALSSLLEAVKLTPDSVHSWNNLGLAYAGKGEFRRAEDSWKKALALKGNSDSRLNLGALYLQQKRYSESERLLKEVTKDLLYDKTHQAHFNLGLLYKERGQKILAEQQLKLAVQGYPSHCASWYLLGQIQKERGSLKEATESLTKSVSGICFNNPAAHFEIAALYLREQNIARAKSKFIEVIEFFPKSEWAKKAEVSLNMLR